MIDSILHRHTDPVVLNNITTPDDIITSPKEIKDIVKDHFENWTKPNPTNENFWAEWEETYKPNNNIDQQ